MPSKPVSSPRIKQEPGVHESLTTFATGYRPDDKTDVKAEVKDEVDDGFEYSAEGEDNSDDDASMSEEDEDAEEYVSDDRDSEDAQQDDEYNYAGNCKETEPVHPLYYLDKYGPSLCSGLNSKGDYFCRHAFRSDHPSAYRHLVYWQSGDPRPYHYKNHDGSIYFRNPDQSTYYWSAEKGYSRYISPDGNWVTENGNPNLQAELELYCFPCHELDGKQFY